MKLYSGIFFENGLHVTFDFNPPNPVIPHPFKDGDEINVWCNGIVILNEFTVLKCDIGHLLQHRTLKDETRFSHQYNSDVPLHITLHTASNIRPVETGRYLRKNPDKIVSLVGRSTALIGKWGYFEK
tara:strand:+ start:57 stop:437 length:381 start_codon:yes stop_codon:yes gene_type:complete